MRMHHSSTSTSATKHILLADYDYAGMDALPAVNEMTVLGNGYFIVRDPITNERYATQSGHFSLDCDGYLITDLGGRVQGRTYGAHSPVGDLQINAAGLASPSCPKATMMCYSIDERGKIIVYLTDGTSFLRGQVMLQNFSDPEALVHEGEQLYSNLSAAGPLPALAAPRSNGLGAIQWGFVELAHAGSPIWNN